MRLIQPNAEHGPPRVARDQRSLLETPDQAVAPNRARPRHSKTMASEMRLPTEGLHVATHWRVDQAPWLRDVALSQRENSFPLGAREGRHQSTVPSCRAGGSLPLGDRTGLE